MFADCGAFALAAPGEPGSKDLRFLASRIFFWISGSVERLGA